MGKEALFTIKAWCPNRKNFTWKHFLTICNKSILQIWYCLKQIHCDSQAGFELTIHSKSILTFSPNIIENYCGLITMNKTILFVRSRHFYSTSDSMELACSRRHKITNFISFSWHRWYVIHIFHCRSHVKLENPHHIVEMEWYSKLWDQFYEMSRDI